MNRRQFLINNLAVVAAGLLPGVRGTEAAGNYPSGLPRLSDAQTMENFAAYRGEKFLVRGFAGEWKTEILRLVDVLDKGADDRVEQFWLQFETGSDSILEKNVYTFEHRQSGRFRLWVEPGETASGARSVWARFNVLKNFDPAMAPVGVMIDPMA